MVTNPMQRKARNSVLLGVVIGLLIGAVIIVFLFLQLKHLQDEKTAKEQSTKTVYVLKNDVKSGTAITMSMLETQAVPQSVIPTDFISPVDITENTIAKIDLTKGTVLSRATISESNEKQTSDLREQQYNMVVLPQNLDIDKYIDIRLRLPNGQDYIVVSKKRIKQITADTIWVNMYEEETLAMSNAIVEAYIVPGSILYATTYVEPGNQANATPTYRPSNEVISLINTDSNITNEARNKLNAAYSGGISDRRQEIQNQVNQYAEDAQDNVESKVQDEVTKAQEARKEYFDSLNANLN